MLPILENQILTNAKKLSNRVGIFFNTLLRMDSSILTTHFQLPDKDLESYIQNLKNVYTINSDHLSQLLWKQTKKQKTKSFFVLNKQRSIFCIDRTNSGTCIQLQTLLQKILLNCGFLKIVSGVLKHAISSKQPLGLLLLKMDRTICNVNCN